MKDRKCCILLATPKDDVKPAYLLFPYKEWRKLDVDMAILPIVSGTADVSDSANMKLKMYLYL